MNCFYLYIEIEIIPFILILYPVTSDLALLVILIFFCHVFRFSMNTIMSPMNNDIMFSFANLAIILSLVSCLLIF